MAQNCSWYALVILFISVRLVVLILVYCIAPVISFLAELLDGFCIHYCKWHIKISNFYCWIVYYSFYSINFYLMYFGALLLDIHYCFKCFFLPLSLFSFWGSQYVCVDILNSLHKALRLCSFLYLLFLFLFIRLDHLLSLYSSAQVHRFFFFFFLLKSSGKAFKMNFWILILIVFNSRFFIWGLCNFYLFISILYLVSHLSHTIL